MGRQLLGAPSADGEAICPGGPFPLPPSLPLPSPTGAAGGKR